jgi:hypothetical protein
MSKTTPHLIETRADGLPWTREGCNEWRAGAFVPYASKAAALAVVEQMKTDRTVYDDPFWARAEYRVVPAKKGSK